MTIYEDLQWRGLIQDISSPDLIDKLNKGGLTFYIGTDPTADSLHLGHYSSFLITKRLAKAGHNPIILVGGATGLIGDPRGTEERKLSDKEIIFHNFNCLKEQVQKIFPYPVVNNYDWVKDISVIDFLRDYGKFINVGYMLGKDLVRRQMENSGISYAEFSYMLIQGLDFKYLHENMGVDLQVAGSDQWGNATTGIELIRKTTGDEVYVFTMPLVTDSKGKKFGKSEGNAIWLDREKTSPYELYQFLFNCEDEMVITYLKRLTFLSREEIEQIEKEHLQAPELRIAQKRLAREIIVDLHGEDAFVEAEQVSQNLFNGDIKKLAVKDLIVAFKNVPHCDIKADNIVNVLVDSQICKSKREANEFVNSGAISVNGETIKDAEFEINKSVAIDESIVIIRRGKKKYYFCNLAK
ncbi:MAG: tyrosine--tRNA ligase [Clostridia bacterium]|nr:tyrosine--tRNA ligase [Clostridia bacterium]